MPSAGGNFWLVGYIAISCHRQELNFVLLFRNTYFSFTRLRQIKNQRNWHVSEVTPCYRSILTVGSLWGQQFQVGNGEVFSLRRWKARSFGPLLWPAVYVEPYHQSIYGLSAWFEPFFSSFFLYISFPAGKLMLTLELAFEVMDVIQKHWSVWIWTHDGKYPPLSSLGGPSPLIKMLGSLKI